MVPPRPSTATGNPRLRRFGFGLGLVLAVIAAATLVAQVFSLLAHGGYVPVSLGSVWYSAHANSLVGLQALVENRLSPRAWPAVFWLLQLPAWLVTGVAGAAMLFACRPRGRRFD
jgi:hypothetical protein